MNNIAYIILLAFALILGLLLIAFLIMVIWEKIDDRRMRIKLKERDDIFEVSLFDQTLFKRMMDFCELNSIPVAYSSDIFKDNEKAIGKIIYTKTVFGGHKYFKDYRIFLMYMKEFLERTANNGFFGYVSYVCVFAHEIGHYLSISNYNDESEEGADFEGYKLIMSLLTDKEKENELIIMAIDIYMNKDELKNYAHYKQDMGLWNPEKKKVVQ